MIPITKISLILNSNLSQKDQKECFKDDNASQWKSGKFDSRSLRNPWIDRHLNLQGWLRRGHVPLCKISSRYDYPPPFASQICENAHQVTGLVFWFFLPPTAKTPAPIFTINTANDAVSRKDVPFGVPKTKFYISTPIPPERKFFANFRRDFENFASKPV